MTLLAQFQYQQCFVSLLLLTCFGDCNWVYCDVLKKWFHHMVNWCFQMQISTAIHKCLAWQPLAFINVDLLQIVWWMTFLVRTKILNFDCKKYFRIVSEWQKHMQYVHQCIWMKHCKKFKNQKADKLNCKCNSYHKYKRDHNVKHLK